jgi:hypothetical protein
LEVPSLMSFTWNVQVLGKIWSTPVKGILMCI